MGSDVYFQFLSLLFLGFYGSVGVIVVYKHHLTYIECNEATESKGDESKCVNV